MLSKLFSWFRPEPVRYAPSLEDFERFVRVGCVSLEDWATLPESLRCLLDEAARRVSIERTVSLAAALSGPEGMAAAVSEVDGGEALVGLRLQALADRVVRGAA